MSIKMKRLEEVACVFDDRCAPVRRGAAVAAEGGRNRLYVETGFIPFDDYAFDGRFLLLGSVCNVEAPSGCLQVTEARGKLSATDLYHVVHATTMPTRFICVTSYRASQLPSMRT